MRVEVEIVAIVYRGMWSDADEGVSDRLTSALAEWVDFKTRGELGLAAADSADGAFRVRVENGEDADGPVVSAFRFSLVETYDDGTRWTTTVRHWSGPALAEELGGPGDWIWVDVDAVAHDSLDHVTVAAPRFVRTLLSGSRTARRRCVPLSGAPITYRGESGAEELAEIVTALDRDLPVVVFAPLPADFELQWAPPAFSVADAYAKSVERAVSINAGLAQVCLLDDVSAVAFKEILGEDYVVRDGAFRVYQPGADPALGDSWKHRYTVAARYLRYQSAGAQISRAIALRAGTRRPAGTYEHAAALLEAARSGGSAEDREMLGLAIAESENLAFRLADLDQLYRDAIEEQQTLEEENNRLRRELGVAWKRMALMNNGASADELEIGDLDSDDHSDLADSPSTAAWLARDLLADHLSFPEAACVDLKDLDNAVNARAWGQTSWRAFRALHAYGEALSGPEDPGSFWTWCEKSGHPHAWTATSKKLSMAESETLLRNKKFVAKRIFPVDVEHDPSGKVFMQAHIKVAQGGGQLSPRIYFVSSRERGKVHIGYFGPHKHVPNSHA
ncbi:hypothetical protein ACFWN2_38125 [Lentzea sp. NPDC058436]|uniref:hypothetical protein n=1 Tax=Lentzea sp. NPDC058436 TaxID=3346499 RepID=UPI003656EFF8